MTEINRDELPWRKSTRSAGNGECTEVAITRTAVYVRDSKDPTGPVLSFSGASWDAFVGGAKEGEFDRG